MKPGVNIQGDIGVFRPSVVSGGSYYFRVGFQGDLDRGVVKLSRLELGFNDGGHCYPSHLDDQL